MANSIVQTLNMQSWLYSERKQLPVFLSVTKTPSQWRSPTPQNGMCSNAALWHATRPFEATARGIAAASAMHADKVELLTNEYALTPSTSSHFCNSFWV
jgi:hypothetical protein